MKYKEGNKYSMKTNKTEKKTFKITYRASA